MRFLLSCLVPVGLGVAAPHQDAPALLAKAIAAFERNQQQEIHWNWNADETRTLLGKGGAVLQKLPDVTVESVIRNDGRRCNAVSAWGDGTPPYLLGSDPESRCQATEAFHPGFDVAELLKGSHVRLASRPPKATVLTILPDKERMRSDDPGVRCAASIRATVELDPETSFPREIRGEVTESGCDRSAALPLYYGQAEAVNTRTSFRKGAVFRVKYELQADKFQAPEHSFWIRVIEHYDMPLPAARGNMVYWGRSVPMTAGNSQRIVKESRTTAREFGTQTTVK
jgi:hypothetical protein